MQKYHVLCIMFDHTIRKMWVDDAKVVSLLQERQCENVFRMSTDQVAIITENNNILWQDVKVVETI